MLFICNQWRAGTATENGLYKMLKNFLFLFEKIYNMLYNGLAYWNNNTKMYEKQKNKK